MKIDRSSRLSHACTSNSRAEHGQLGSLSNWKTSAVQFGVPQASGK